MDLVSQLPHGICHFDANNFVLVANRAFTSQLELSEPDEILGLSREELLNQISDSQLKDALMQITDKHDGCCEPQPTCVATDSDSVTISCEALESGGYALLLNNNQNLVAKKNLDSLTNVLNREGFAEKLEEICKLAMESGEPVSLLYLDLDRFKHVNDTYGHETGDQVLISVTDRIKEEIRATDIFARLGGDEFAIIQTNSPQPSGSRTLGRRIIESVSKPIHLNGHDVSVGVSVGMSIFPYDAESASELLQISDLAMYSAKASGRNQMRYFEPAMSERLNARRTLETDLLRGLEHDQFELYYQPVKDVANDQIVAIEALIRWNHPELGMVSPDQFISVAEESGLIVQLGEWVLRQACEEAVQWPGDVRVAVNVSTVQLRDRRFASLVLDVLRETGLAPHRLELEITESALVADVDLTIAILKELRDNGVKIALDDFGTGYSSINYLRRFPFDKIKTDRSFVSGATSDSESAALVRMIAALGVSLSVATTAEGVETQSEIDMVREAGCSQIQGYALSRPVPSSELAKLLTPPAQSN